MNKRKSFNKDTRIKVYNKYNGHCAYCGKEIEINKMQIDHLFPFDSYGKECFENYMPSCRRCNKYKSNSFIYQFRRNLEEIPRKLKAYQTTYNIGLNYGFIKEIEKPKIIFYFEKIDGEITMEKYFNLQMKGEELENEIRKRVDEDVEGWYGNLRSEEEKKKMKDGQFKILKQNADNVSIQIKEEMK